MTTRQEHINRINELLDAELRLFSTNNKGVKETIEWFNILVEETPDQRECPECNWITIKKDHKFCPVCGTKLTRGDGK